jgi:dTDP-4-amino-4,6-dideoxygalactose transaminase
MINIAQPIIGSEERRAVLEVLDSGMLAQGPRVEAFEAAFSDFCGVEFAIATASGTTALLTTLLAHQIGDGDEVITTPFTFIASANSILLTGAKPVFVDIDPITFNLNPERIKTAITPHTKAIMPVHLFGLSCDMDPIMEIAEEHGLAVIEDACQSHGAIYKGRQTGSFGTGTFSLYPTKNMTSAEGGMITTSNSLIAELCRMIRQPGVHPWQHRYELGFNFRMSDIHAAIGLEQLKKIAIFNRTRKDNARFFNTNLQGVIKPSVPEGYEHVFHQYTVRLPGGGRDALVEYLRNRGIGTGVYYPIPIHKQPYYLNELGNNQMLPESERAAAEVLSLPVHPGLEKADLEKIISCVNAFTKDMR